MPHNTEILARLIALARTYNEGRALGETRRYVILRATTSSMPMISCYMYEGRDPSEFDRLAHDEKEQYWRASFMALVY